MNFSTSVKYTFPDTHYPCHKKINLSPLKWSHVHICFIYWMTFVASITISDVKYTTHNEGFSSSGQRYASYSYGILIIYQLLII